MVALTTEVIVKLREKTGCGMMDCKKALAENNGDMDKAIEHLRKKGLASIAKRADKVAAQGIVESYIHTGGKIGVLVEVNCETDFVAKNEDFIGFAKTLAMQIAAQCPQFISREEVPENLLLAEKDIASTQAKNEGKPDKAIEKIVEGRVEKYYEQVCLIDQPYIKDPKIKIKDLLGGIAAKTGENIVIRRFTRYQLGASS